MYNVCFFTAHVEKKTVAVTKLSLTLNLTLLLKNKMKPKQGIVIMAIGSVCMCVYAKSISLLSD